MLTTVRLEDVLSSDIPLLGTSRAQLIVENSIQKTVVFSP